MLCSKKKKEKKALAKIGLAEEVPLTCDKNYTKGLEISST